MGVYMPAPRELASLWPTLDPDTKRLAISTWGVAGMSEAQIERELSFFTPRGTGGAASTALLR